MYKLKIIFAILLTLCIIESSLCQTNYCKPGLCKKYERHIGCNNNGAIYLKNATIISMTSSMQKLIVNQHNTLRNKIAANKLYGYKGGNRMATMRWNPELSTLAEYNVKKSKIGHDQCRNTDEFSYSGQNYALTKWWGMEYSVKELVKRHINGWYDEYKICSMSVIKKLISFSGYGHFTAMVQEKNTAVGCAILRQTLYGKTMQLMTCNYAYTNIINKPVYKTGAFNCTTGRNPQYKSLCSLNEKYDLKSTNF